MGRCCSGRCLLISICVLQLVTTVERQVFEFLGFMWAPIAGNFLHLIFVIIGLVGACQYRHRILVVYLVWSLIWIGWNAFIICFYLEVGILNRAIKILNIGTDNKSWWYNSGIGCKNDSRTAHDTFISPSPSLSSLSSSRWLSSTTPSFSPASLDENVPSRVMEGCLLQYYYIEVIHAALQCLLALLGFIVACVVIYSYAEEDDASFWESQPVHGELEYIKMRYRSPARQSFRGNKTYENITSCSNDATTLDATYRLPPTPITRSDSCRKDGTVDQMPILTVIPLDEQPRRKKSSDDDTLSPTPLKSGLIYYEDVDSKLQSAI